jgi:hypothetical protein
MPITMQDLSPHSGTAEDSSPKCDAASLGKQFSMFQGDYKFLKYWELKQ